MRFALTEEQLALRGALRELLESVDGAELTREWASDQCAPGHALWKQLTEMGLPGLLVPEESGGLGLGEVELAACLVELGYAGVPGPYVESLAAVPRLLTTPGVDGGEWPRRLAAGRLVTVIPPGSRYAADADQCAAVFDCSADAVRVSAAPRLTAQPAVDSGRRWHTAHLDGESETLATGETARNAAEAAFDQGALGAAAQLLGLGRRLLDLGTEYARQRTQFGRAIGEFQAIKHQLADALRDLEFARPVLYGACLATSAGTPAASRDVSAAKLTASEAAYRAARTALQVHGALGYTAEHELHLWLARVRALRAAWGGPDWHRGRVADALADGVTAPVGEY